MQTPFKQIVGTKLLNIRESKSLYKGMNDDNPMLSVYNVGLEMDKGYLSIENPFTLTIKEKVFLSSDLEIFNILRTLIGSHVTQAWFEKEAINIIFSTAQIKISLKDEDFVSPEAGSYVSNDNSFFLVFTKVE